MNDRKVYGMDDIPQDVVDAIASSSMKPAKIPPIKDIVKDNVVKFEFFPIRAGCPGGHNGIAKNLSGSWIKQGQKHFFNICCAIGICGIYQKLHRIPAVNRGCRGTGFFHPLFFYVKDDRCLVQWNQLG